jgi:POT family proton-dependent oligopeptide transporter
MQAIFSSSMVGGAVLGLAISPTYKDPYLVIVYSALASGMAVATGLFYLQW